MRPPLGKTKRTNKRLKTIRAVIIKPASNTAAIAIHLINFTFKWFPFTLTSCDRYLDEKTYIWSTPHHGGNWRKT